MHFIPVKRNYQVFYSSWVFWWIPALPKPWTRTCFNCRAAAAVASRALPHTGFLSVGGTPLRERKHSVLSSHHLSSWPHYTDHLQGCQLASAALCWTGICGSTQWEPHLRQPHGQLSTQPPAHGTGPLCSPPNSSSSSKLPDRPVWKTSSRVFTLCAVAFNCKLAVGNKEGWARCELPAVCRGVWKARMIRHWSCAGWSASPLHVWGLLWLQYLHFKPSAGARARGHTLLLAGHPTEHLYFRCYEGSKGPCYLVASSAHDFRLVFVVSWALQKLAAFSAPKRST